MRTSRLEIWFRHWLIGILVAFALAACGGRSDEDAIGPAVDGASVADGDTDAGDVAKDGTVNEADASSDASTDASSDASSIDADATDVSIDARIDGPVDAGPDLRIDAPTDAPIDVIRDALVDVTPIDASDGSARVLLSISVTPPSVTLSPGTTAALTVTGTYSDATTADLTDTATFSTSATATATVTGNVVTAVAPGTATIAAVVNGERSTASITVTPATITSIAVTPGQPSTRVGATLAFTAVATLSDGNHQDVTSSAVWTSSNGTVASVSSTGQALGLATGATSIQATVGSVSGMTTLTVTSIPLVSIAVTPTAPVIGVAVMVPFTATGTYSDGSIADVTDSAIWTSSDTGTLAVTATGAGTSVAPGTSIVTASVGTISGTTTVTVTPAALQSITVTPASSTIAVAGTEQLVATGVYSDMTTVDLTTSVTWSSSLPSAVFVSSAAASSGLVSGLAAGSATITATLGTTSGVAKVTVTAATLDRIDITPVNPSIPLGTTLSLKAEGTYSDGSSIDITTSVTWSTDDAVTASVSNAPGSNGRATGNAAGTTQAHAALGGVTGSTTLTVSSAALVSITVTPANSTLLLGIRQTMTATGVYSDMSTVDLTTTVVWTTGSTAVATVSNAKGAAGQVTATGAGTTTVTATLGATAGSTNVTVTAPALSQLVVTPLNPTNRVGQTRQFTAVAVFSNGTQQNVTGRAMWSTSNMAVATINGTGLATARAVGATTISASFQGLMGSSSLTVNNPVPVSISVTPFAPSTVAGTTVQFQATAIYSDNTTQNVTGQATWVSSNAMVAGIATAGPNRGQARALAAGTTTIQATWQGLTDSTTLTVTAAVPVSISVDPAATSVAIGTVVPFSATLIYSDSSTRNVTAQATWTSSAVNVARVTTAGGMRGQATAIGEGTATISATFSGITGSATMTVTAATLVRIQITPFSPTLPVGFNTQLTATGIYSDNSTRDLTSLATWTSNANGVASVSTAAGSRGQLTPLSAGTATISASYQGTTGTDTITVSSATLTSIAISPADTTIMVSGSVQYTATGTFSDGSQMDVTGYVTWLSSNPSIADVGDAAGTRGLARGFAAGTITVSAVRGSVTGTTSLKVQ